jgi:penicillin-binding protein 2
MERASTRLRALALLVALMFVALTARLWFLQVLEGPEFRESARDNGVRFEYLEPLRGQIYDRNGVRLVTNRRSLQVRVTRDELGPDSERVILRLADILRMDVADLSRAINTNQYYTFQAVPVAEFVPEKVKFYIDEHPELFPGVEVEKVSVRGYPFRSMAAHTLGYVGLITEKTLAEVNAREYSPNDVIGRAGLESVYEKYLRGTRGRQKFIVNADGETIREAARIEPIAGDDLHLTLDAGWQRIAEEELHDGMQRAHELEDSENRSLRATGGAVVILDAATGAVRAMASLPSYDPRWYVRGLTKHETAYLNDDTRAPSVNRSFGLAYTPGSTLKAITALIADHDLPDVDLHSLYPCVTTYVHGTDELHPFSNWESMPGGSVTMSFADALRMSCDTFFYRFGSEFYQYWVDHQLSENAQPLQASLRGWGFESPTGIDLPGEDVGLVPDAAWAEAQAAEDTPDIFEDGRWLPFGDILTMTGAGNITVTPMQLAVAYGAIANGGHLCQPYVLDHVTSADDRIVDQTKERCGNKLPYAVDDLGYIRDALQSVVTSGTASCAFSGFPLGQVPVAGKTGTAERGNPEQFQDTSWFAAIVGPDDQPGYVVVTMVEQGGFGAQVAAPITRAVIERVEGLGDTPQSSCSGDPDTEDR